MKKTIIVFLIAAAPLCLFAQLPSYLPTDGLVGWWPFNGNANDESGNSNNGTVNGATLTIDRFGNSNRAYNFNGISNYINTTSSVIPTNGDYSINIWLFCPSNSGLNTEALSQGGTLINSTYIGYLANGNIRIGGGSNWTWDNITSFPFNAWHMFTVIKKSPYSFLYIDNIKIDSSNTYTNPVSSGSTIFGRQQNNLNNEWWNGKIDDIGIWNRALTPSEITALYTGVPTNNNNSGNTATTTVPAAISYQAVARNAQGQPLSDAAVQVKFTLLTDSLTGVAEYSESHPLTTNSLGLFTTAFGAGTPETGTFAAINWASGSKYLKVELDTGSGYVDMGTQQLLSVPYAMRSNTSAKSGTIENTGIPVYTNNAAALAGGLVAGQMYRTATGDLMIVY